LKGGLAMQKKKGTIKAAVFLVIVVMGTLFLTMACTGRSTQVQKIDNSGSQEQQETDNEEAPLIFWNPEKPTKTTFEFTSPDVINYFKANNIDIAIFGSPNKGYRLVWVDNYKKAIEVEPCLEIDEQLPGTCKSFGGGSKYKGKESISYFKTRKNPPCVAITLGGYIFEFNPLTGGPCS